MPVRSRDLRAAREAVCPPSHEGRRLEAAGDHTGVPRAGGTRDRGAVEPRTAGDGPRRRDSLLGRCTRTVMDPIK